MVFAAGPRDGLCLKCHHFKIIFQATTAKNRVKSSGKLRILGGDACRVAAFMPVIIGSSSGAKLLILCLPHRIIVTQRNQCCGANRHRICTQRHRFGNISTTTDATRHDQLHLAMHPQILQGLNRLWDTGQDWHTNVFDEHVLRGSSAALHAIQHHNISTGFDRKRRIVIRARATDLDIDRLFPIGDFTQLKDLDFKIIWAGPIRVTTGRPLVNSLGQVAHFGHAVRNFLAQKHTATTGLCPLANNNLNRVSPAQIIWVHAITRGQILVDQRF